MDDTGRRPSSARGPDVPADWPALKERALGVAAEGVTIADARIPGRPLIYVNEGFERMTGYAPEEVIGRNCRFLQGPASDPAAVTEIRTAIAERRPCVVEILNHRKDGTKFWNRLSITPVRDPSGEVTHFIGIQSDVTARREAEDGLRRAKESMEQDLRLAASVQKALLPPADIESGTLRIAHAFHPCEDLAGDGVGLVPLPGGKLGLYLLDVSGHGVRAALLSFALNHVLSSAVGGPLLTEDAGGVPSFVPPALVAERLNRQFPMDRSRQYFTLVYGVIDPASGDFRYVVAGHPSPVLLPQGGAPCAVAGRNLPIGMIDDAAYGEESLRLRRGDRLYFFTDGVVEASSAGNDPFGLDRLLAGIARHRDLALRAGLDRIATEILDWCGGRPGDDITLLAVERTR